MSVEPPRRRVTFTKSAQKGVQALPAHVREASKAVLRALADGTERGKRLRGELSDLRSVRLGRTHRLLYRETPEEIQVVDAGPRGDVYKR